LTPIAVDNEPTVLDALVESALMAEMRVFCNVPLELMFTIPRLYETA
jgi:hypothetical protein